MDGKDKAASPAPLSARLAEVGARLRTNPAAARDEALNLLKIVPGEPHALMLLVSACRLMGDQPGARDLLQGFAEAMPGVAAIQRELGLLLSDVRESEGAAAALSRAAALEPDDSETWLALGNEYSRMHGAEDGAAAYQKFIGAQLPELESLEAASTGNRSAAAEQNLQRILAQQPTNVVALYNLANLNLLHDRRRQTEMLLERALALAPDFSEARHMYAWSLFRSAKYQQSLQQLDRLLQSDAENADYLRLKASALLAYGDYDRALVCLEQLIAKGPQLASAWADYGHALRIVGRREQAVAALRKAVSLKPSLGGAWWNLASLRTFRFEPGHIEIMRRELERKDLDADTYVRMHHALGKALEDEKQYAESFAHYTKGKALHGKAHPYDARATTDALKRITATFTRHLFESHAQSGSAAPDPIFIVGMTRAGSTLVEQILASHPMIEGTKELRIMNLVLDRINDPANGRTLRYPEVVAKLDPESLLRLAEEYLGLARPHRQLDRPYFIDKSPGNFQQTGLIHLMLPNAKIIDARRHPLACGFANFRHYFPHGQSFTSDLGNFGHFYRTYVELMAHFDAVLPGRVHRVFYEELVANPEREIRALLAYCGVPFDGRCLRFYETRRSVLTPSSEQVRQPIFTDALEQWHHYEPWLGPLKAALGNVLTAYPTVPASFESDSGQYPTMSFQLHR